VKEQTHLRNTHWTTTKTTECQVLTILRTEPKITTASLYAQQCHVQRRTSMSEFRYVFVFRTVNQIAKQKFRRFRLQWNSSSAPFFNDKPIQDIKKKDLRLTQSSGMWCQRSMTGKTRHLQIQSIIWRQKIPQRSCQVYPSTRPYDVTPQNTPIFRDPAVTKKKNTLRFSLRLINPHSPVVSEPTVERGPILSNENKFVRTVS
jgi:hypothetical protein